MNIVFTYEVIKMYIFTRQTIGIKEINNLNKNSYHKNSLSHRCLREKHVSGGERRWPRKSVSKILYHLLPKKFTKWFYLERIVVNIKTLAEDFIGKKI